MGGVDKSDQLLSYHNVLRRTVRYWKTVLDVGIVNSFILYNLLAYWKWFQGYACFANHRKVWSWTAWASYMWKATKYLSCPPWEHSNTRQSALPVLQTIQEGKLYLKKVSRLSFCSPSMPNFGEGLSFCLAPVLNFGEVRALGLDKHENKSRPSAQSFETSSAGSSQAASTTSAGPSQAASTSTGAPSASSQSHRGRPRGSINKRLQRGNYRSKWHHLL